MVAEAPTEEEEVSASTFLAAVKCRLTEWGKEEQYHEVLAALSYDVDVKTVVRILRGHDDLLWVFRRKFAPKADLRAIKAEVADEAGPQSRGGGGPQPPSGPPSSKGSRLVKEELSSSTPFTPSASGQPVRSSADDSSGPRPPKFPPTRGVKRELVKTEGGLSAAPRPPKFAPGAKRVPVTIGDDSDEEDELQDEATILAAVKKGRTECVAELAKLIFRRERSAHGAARLRLAMVRYATQRSAIPRFPRELFILRGAPGVGKTEYAMQHLRDNTELDNEDDEIAARLTHVCSADDFFERFTSVDGSTYKFEIGKVESYHRKNEMRVRLAMEAGIHPLYVDCTNLRLWEMRPYVELAENLGYVPQIVEPQEISDKFDDVDFLVEANDTADRRQRGKVVPRGLVAACLKAFEPLQDVEEAVEDMEDVDLLAKVREAERSNAARLLQALPEPKPVKPQPPTRAPTRAPGLGAAGAHGAGPSKGGGKGGKQMHYQGAYPREQQWQPARTAYPPRW